MQRGCAMGKTTVRTCQTSRTASGRRRGSATTAATVALAASPTPSCVTAKPTAPTVLMRETVVIEEEEMFFFLSSPNILCDLGRPLPPTSLPTTSSSHPLLSLPSHHPSTIHLPPSLHPSALTLSLLLSLPPPSLPLLCSPRCAALPCRAALPLRQWPVFV